MVYDALDALTELLKELKGIVIQGQGHLEAVLGCIRNVFNKAVLQILRYIYMIFNHLKFCL